MKPSLVFAALSIPVAVGVAAPVAAQIFQASGYATVTMAGLGNQTTVASESRIPILPRDVSYDRAAGANARLRVRATGHRGVVRQLDIEVAAPRVGARYEFGPNSGASLRIRTERGPEVAAESGRGNITITALDERRVAGTYEGTFRGATPMVVRGRFEATFPRQRAPGTNTTRQ